MVRILKSNLLLSFFITCILNSCAAQQKVEEIDFSSEKWKTLGAAKVENKNSETITSISDGVGIAYLDGYEFTDGIIECDLYSPSEKAYLGLVFRVNLLTNFECIYFQPHTSGKWDAVQYDPIINSSATWQLYHGEGFQASAKVPTRKWFHVKIAVIGDSAKVYLDHSENHVLAVELQHDFNSGSVGVYSYHPAKFKNLSVTKYQAKIDAKEKSPDKQMSNKYLTDWSISESYDNYNFSKNIDQINEKISKWNSIQADKNGLINLNKHFTKSRTLNTVLAKLIIEPERPQTKKLNIGYSDKIRVFLNSKNLFVGNNSYFDSGMYTDRGYVLGKGETIELPLVKGKNELLLEIAEDKFGWGFKASLSDLENIENLNIKE